MKNQIEALAAEIRADIKAGKTLSEINRKRRQLTRLLDAEREKESNK